jgi:hypothetical protein
VKNIASPDKNEIRLRRLVPASVFTALHRDKKSRKQKAESRKQKARLHESFFHRQSTKDDLRGNAESVFAG